MYWPFLYFFVVIDFSCGYESQSRNVEENSKAVGVSDNKNVQELNKLQSNGVLPWQQHFWKPPKSTGNVTYFDKNENIIRLPELSKLYEEKKAKKSLHKKYPKRIIQKIIKKNGSKMKKIHKAGTKRPTINTKESYDNYYAEELSQWKNDATTTQPKQKKRSRKRNPKVVRNPLPFHNMHKNNRRNKRDARDNVFIFKDFDEMKFLREGKNYNVVNAHVKKYW